VLTYETVLASDLDVQEGVDAENMLQQAGMVATQRCSSLCPGWVCSLIYHVVPCMYA